MKSILKVWSERRAYRRNRDVMIWIEKDDGRQFAASIRFEKDITDGLADPLDTPFESRPDGVDGEQFLQAVLDHAWSIGMRPAGFLDTTNQVGAMREHLHDLRAIVFSGKIEPKK